LEWSPDLLLAPTRLYTRDVERLLAAGAAVRAAAHITGGGIPENLPRALPAHLGARLHPGSWEPNAAMRAVLDTGRVADAEAWSTFNMGLGMCLIVAPEAVEAALREIDGAALVGAVERGAGVRHG